MKVYRTVHYGDHGPDVRAWGRALRKYLAAHGKPAANRQSGLFGKGMLKDVDRARQLAGLGAGHVIGPRLQHALAPHLDAYGRALLKLPIIKPPSPEERAGAAFAGWCRWAVANRARFRYAEVRPIPHPAQVAAGGTIYTDCSGSGILGHEEAKTPDPNGTGYNGSGSTYSLEPRGQRIEPAQARAGDGSFYRGHVGWFLGKWADYAGQIFTFGHNPPLLTSYTYRPDRTSSRQFPLTQEETNV